MSHVKFHLNRKSVLSEAEYFYDLLLNSRQRSEHGFNFVSERKWVRPWLKVMHDFALPIDQEFGEVPRDDLGLIRSLIVKLAIVTKITVNRVCVGTVYLYL